MRRILAVTAILALAAAVAPAWADTKTVRGEVIDVQCHTKKAENKGEGHANCALACARKGATMGILAEDGVYQITGEFAADKNRKLLDYVAKTVVATGEVTEHDGHKMIDIKKIEVAKQ
ncbi:MAG TPA: hypothetical protein VNK92_01205 [Vicinamibacterales bacterium]|jgi:hypothetical protein|nr:hypothetical protein [Vicinamibacterales bacterium]